MAKNSDKTQGATVTFPRHLFSDPKDLLVFLEMPGFMDDWSDLDLDVEDDLLALQITIMLDPQGSPVVPGTGGLRKLRFAPPNWNKGKRGALRVCYVFFEELGIVLLVVAYSKAEHDDLTEAGKKAMKKEIERQEELLRNGFYK